MELWIFKYMFELGTWSEYLTSVTSFQKHNKCANYASDLNLVCANFAESVSFIN